MSLQSNVRGHLQSLLKCCFCESGTTKFISISQGGLLVCFKMMYLNSAGLKNYALIILSKIQEMISVASKVWPIRSLMLPKNCKVLQIF